MFDSIFVLLECHITIMIMMMMMMIIKPFHFDILSLTNTIIVCVRVLSNFFRILFNCFLFILFYQSHLCNHDQNLFISVIIVFFQFNIERHFHITNIDSLITFFPIYIMIVWLVCACVCVLVRFNKTTTTTAIKHLNHSWMS